MCTVQMFLKVFLTNNIEKLINIKAPKTEREREKPFLYISHNQDITVKRNLKSHVYEIIQFYFTKHLNNKLVMEFLLLKLQ